MSKIYLVSEVGWEYDDEYHYRPDSKGVLPKNAYFSKEKAQAECDRLNIEFFRESFNENDFEFESLFGYISPFNENVLAKEAYRILENFGIYDQDDLHKIKDLSDEQLKQLLPYLEVVFYQIDEVEVND